MPPELDEQYIQKLMNNIRNNKNSPAFKKIKSAWYNANKRSVPAKMVSLMRKGTSPVAGHEFASYSDSYINAIEKGRYSQYSKAKTPVNLKLSGDLHKSIVAEENESGFSVFTENPIAEYHQDGTDNMSARKIFPEEGDSFHSSVSDLLDKSLRRISENVLFKLFGNRRI